MLLKILLILSCNVLLIKSEVSDDKVIIDGRQSHICTIEPEYTFIDGQKVKIIFKSSSFVNYGTWIINHHTLVPRNFNGREPELETKVDPSFAGEWRFDFYNLRDNTDVNAHKIQIDGHNFTQRECSTMVRIKPAPPSAVNTNNLVIILIAVGVILTLITLAQAAYIVYLKAKAKKLNRHENLSKKTESICSNDRARYCSNPGQKVIKVAPIIEPDRDSDIYEAPNMQLPEREPAQTPQVPQPPAVATIPRTPRIDPDLNRLGPLALAAAMSGSRHQPQTGTYPTPKTNQHEINVANRPPLPLPPQEMYEEMPTEENTYEPPPIKNIPPVKPATPHKLTKDQLDTAVKALSMKPAVTPKPQRPTSDHMKIPNELENAWRRRNVVQVPIVSIPGPSTRGTSPHKPRPPPVVKSKPPIPQPVDQGIYYNQRHDSSDEEWTYEPLKPMKGYSSDNIYNV